jgi:hypothetical protein
MEVEQQNDSTLLIQGWWIHFVFGNAVRRVTESNVDLTVLY